MIQNCDIDSKLVVVIHFSHFVPGHTALLYIEIVSTEEGTFNFWAQEVTEHRKSL